MPSDPHARLKASRPATAGATTTGVSTTTRSHAAPIIEPYVETVNIMTQEALPGARAQGHIERARVMTYRQMPSDFEMTQNKSPMHGSQSPWHQRYSHYKYNGYAGKGE